ncbi:MAG TPA: class I SAM-dependent methyltransferase [Anaerolineales bacterium]|nr:class I SAM-dependent methyltransferase [Anaerolineales bacterium]
MGIDRTRRITFEEVADLYNETRTGYPDELVNDIFDLSAMVPDSRILEVGCGPGNATVSFAGKGNPILGIELGEQLAQFARENCKQYPNVTIVQSTFEDYDLPPHGFDLAISADAFHWIPPEIGYPKIMQALKETGFIAFFWHVPLDPQTDWSKAVDELFSKHAPDFDNPHHAFSLEWLVEIIKGNFQDYCGIKNVTVKAYDWVETISADTFIKLLRTYSSHRHMDEELRQLLYADIRTVINDFGGSVEKPYQVVLFHAKISESKGV